MSALRFLSAVLFFGLMSIPVFAEESAQAKAFPYRDQIHAIMDQVEYSGVESILRPEVALNLNFDQKSWTLTHIHQYDDKGHIILDEGKYGLCAELATYMYQKLLPILTDRFDLKFAQCTESGFFPTQESNHVVLLVHDALTNDVFLIDPSFKQFDLPKNLPQYTILGVQDMLLFARDRSMHNTYQVDQAMPLLIMDDFLLSFSISSVDGKFDKDNYMMLVSANHRNKDSEFLNVLVVGRYKGEEQSFESKKVLSVFLKPKDMHKLYLKLREWLHRNDLT